MMQRVEQAGRVIDPVTSYAAVGIGGFVTWMGSVDWVFFLTVALLVVRLLKDAPGGLAGARKLWRKWRKK